MKRRFAAVVTAGTLGTASVLGIGLTAPAARATPDEYSETVSQDRGGDLVTGALGPGGTNLQTAAGVLGMEVAALHEELGSGATLGDLARERDIEQVALVRALAQEQESRLEQWLQDA